MTEADWLSCDDPQRILAWLTNAGAGGASIADLGRKLISARKLRLFACACARQHGGLDATKMKEIDAVEALEGKVSVEQYLKISPLLIGTSLDWATWWAEHKDSDGSRRAALLRDIVGNPCRPVPDMQNMAPCPHCLELHQTKLRFRDRNWAWRRDTCVCQGRRIVQQQVVWLTPTVAALARAAYDEPDPMRGVDLSRRLPDGMLDPQRLLVLSDALEEAGCNSEELLRHLRGQERATLTSATTISQEVVHGWRPLRGPHVRGCWALDLLLGKE